MNEFFTVYLAIGPKYINRSIKMLQYIPDNSNVLILTNTPEAFNISLPLNLHVVQIEDWRTDAQRRQEVLVCSTNPAEYDTLIIDKPFPMGVMRHAISWLLENNITKFMLLDCGSRVHTYEKNIQMFSEITSHTNIIFSNPRLPPKTRSLKEFINDINCIDVVESFGIDLNNIPPGYYRPDLHDTNNDILVNGMVQFEGFVVGGWFNNKTHLEIFYNMWNKMSDRAYESNRVPCLYDIFQHRNTIWEFEVIFNPLAGVFNRYYNTLLCSFNNIIQHSYTYSW